jgi:hypothetical protein
MRSKDEADQLTDTSDPAELLPYSKRFEPHDPNAEKLPAAYQGTDKLLTADNGFGV